ncbi:MAG: 5-formyltetrahydrofolate cyclo-ligase [Lysinibacillus sp.]
MNKEEQRKEVLNSLKEMPTITYREQSFKIAKKFLQESTIIDANTIALTISNMPEVDTVHLIEALWQLGKTVVVPKCNSKKKSMDFYAIEDFSQLETVYMHLREPIPAVTHLVEANDIDVMVVPGVAFDKKGYRIGYGGGYYDRYVVKYSGQLISLIFDEQLCEKVPTEVHDCPVDIILTPTKRLDCLQLRGESY